MRHEKQTSFDCEEVVESSYGDFEPGETDERGVCYRCGVRWQSYWCIPCQYDAGAGDLGW